MESTRSTSTEDESLAVTSTANAELNHTESTFTWLENKWYEMADVTYSCTLGPGDQGYARVVQLMLGPFPPMLKAVATFPHNMTPTEMGSYIMLSIGSVVGMFGFDSFVLGGTNLPLMLLPVLILFLWLLTSSAEERAFWREVAQVGVRESLRRILHGYAEPDVVEPNAVAGGG